MGLYDTYYMDMIREKMERSLKYNVEKFVADWMLHCVLIVVKGTVSNI